MSAAEKYAQRKDNRRKVDESETTPAHFMSAAEKYAQRKENRRKTDENDEEQPLASAHFMSAAEKYAIRKANKRLAEKEGAHASGRREKGVRK